MWAGERASVGGKEREQEWAGRIASVGGEERARVSRSCHDRGQVRPPEGYHS